MATGKDIIKITALAGGAFFLKSAIGRIFEYNLKDKTVLITGGSRGLGLVMAREFAREGSRLAICARDQQELEVLHPGRRHGLTTLTEEAAVRNNEVH